MKNTGFNYCESTGLMNPISLIYHNQKKANSMKKIISILLMSTLPAFAFASGGHAMEGHKHAPHGMNAMVHGNDAADVGKPGDSKKIDRTIHVTMHDTMRFTPDYIKIKKGETIRFAVHNAGKIQHEMVIGTMVELKEHEAMMRANPTMHHVDPNMISLAPGKKGEIIWQFDKVGTFNFACLRPGHLEAGMKGKIVVK